ncbi:DUF4132 domain-containing protein [Acidipropionibacterium acidipropionici]|uniref:DUF4132 domain-containing protein n=1 Tax=Acidipropionibacterium acidipropionici TaxID=1748 RepID=A0AAC8YE29_9ACTN|nr:hypothetical protein AXH35_04405 [Acidipropionibacterium acidipropionici]AOZ46320.1 hypothetical protein A8L58_05870 [Acidipropionibacterium acidipropionici]AZP37642.1 DUF4132 domain-containing protein [Acidipropionibacterium acidipropionici]
MNEDRFELPDSWRQKILPDRDRHRPASAPRIRQEDVDTAQETISSLMPRARRMVAASPSPVRDADPASPLGVAAMTLAMLSAARADWTTRGKLQQTLPQLWLAQMSLPPAVSCAAGLAGLCREEDVEQMIVRPAGTGDGSQVRAVSWTWAAEALRTPVAACEDATHEQVIEVLTSYASAEPLQRLVAAYLAPERGDWAQAALEGADPLPVMALAVPHTGDQLLGLLDRVPSYSVGGTGFTNLVTAVDRIGADALPTLKALLDDDPDAAEARNYYSLIAELPSDEALDLLIDHIDDPRAGASVLTATDRRPGPALDLLARRASANQACAALLAARVRSDRDLASDVADRLPAGAAARIREVLAEGDHPDADPSQLPALLVSPPWAGKRSRKAQTVIEGPAAPDDTHLDWLPGEQQEWLTLPNYRRGDNPPPGLSWQQLADQVLAGERVWGHLQLLLINAPDDLLRPLLGRMTIRDLWQAQDWMRIVLARFADDALPIVLDAARRQPSTCSSLLMPVGGAPVAAMMAGWLRRIAAQAGRPRVEQAASAFGPGVAAALATVLDADPLEALPARMPKPPAWLNPAALPRLLTRADSAVPSPMVPDVVTVLALSSLDDRYAGVQVLRESFDAGILAAFARALFEQWRIAGFPSKQGWVLDAQGFLGDDETVRMLSPLIRAWPKAGGYRRAVNALPVLAAIGTDTALMHLHRISLKVPSKPLRAQAVALIDQIAEERGLTSEELADRLVPDLDLDADGSRVLNYGPRQFTVGFDETLRPFVSQDGVRRKALPKPGAKDDAELAKASYDWFRVMKKEARAVASDQVRRLESAMVSQRSWTPEIFTQVFSEHPFMVHLARRLVWTAQVGGVTVGFRVAEDRTLADVEDEEYTLPDEAEIRVAHPLLLGTDLTAGWSQIFSDYEILQPFEQLGRAVYTPTAEEMSSSTIRRAEARTVKTTKILGLESRGWYRAAPEDAGIQSWVCRDLPGDQTLVIALEPGIIVGDPNFEDFAEQKLGPAILTCGGYSWQNDPDGDLGALGQVLVSEILRDLEWLVS